MVALRTMWLAATIALVAAGAAHAQPCTQETARRVVDDAGARLRTLTAEMQPQIQARLRQLKEKRGWTGPDGDDRAAAVMSDDRTVELDRKATDLLTRIDELAETGGSAEIDCARLAELEAAAIELQATVRTKSRLALQRLDEAIAGEKTTASAPPAAPTESSARPSAPAPAPRPAAPAEAPRPSGPADTARPSPPPEPKAPRPPESRAQPSSREAGVSPPARPSAPTTGWTTETVERQEIPAMPSPEPARPDLPAPLPPPASKPPGLPPMAPADGFSREDIREASRGFFGTVSSGLATVIEHAFSTLGRPTAYVLGTEGGGAFIAGLRYGRGQLFLHDGSRRDVYWHGPSIGYDFGAAGSKTMFLVYNLRRDIDVFSSYTGLDGSAYLVGGVGMTVVTDGRVVMAPIRSGVGLRLGASIGYIRFTARPTWNPF